jgi:hypothetical protein
MDRLLERQSAIQRALAARHLRGCRKITFTFVS